MRTDREGLDVNYEGLASGVRSFTSTSWDRNRPDRISTDSNARENYSNVLLLFTHLFLQFGQNVRYLNWKPPNNYVLDGTEHFFIKTRHHLHF